MSIASVARDPDDLQSVRLTLATEPAGTISISYGDVAPPALGVRFENVVRDADGLPAPRFGPLAVELEYSGRTAWLAY